MMHWTSPSMDPPLCTGLYPLRTGPPDMFKLMKHLLTSSGRFSSYWNAFLFQYQFVTLDDNYLTTLLSEMSLLSKTTDLLKLVQYLSDTGSCYNLADNLTKRLVWIKPTIFLTPECLNLHVKSLLWVSQNLSKDNNFDTVHKRCDIFIFLYSWVHSCRNSWIAIPVHHTNRVPNEIRFSCPLDINVVIFQRSGNMGFLECAAV